MFCPSFEKCRPSSTLIKTKLQQQQLRLKRILVTNGRVWQTISLNTWITNPFNRGYVRLKLNPLFPRPPFHKLHKLSSDFMQNDSHFNNMPIFWDCINPDWPHDIFKYLFFGSFLESRLFVGFPAASHCFTLRVALI